MQYEVLIEGHNYQISVEKKQQEQKETVCKSNPMESTDSYTYCLEAIKEEYLHIIDRSSKLDNKVYILLTVCAFIFSALVSMTLGISKMISPNDIEDVCIRKLQYIYPIVLIVAIVVFLITLILLITLLRNIRVYRLDGKILLEKNLFSYPSKTVAKFIGSKYAQAIDKNNSTLDKRYKQFNLCVIFIIISVILLIVLSCASNFIVYTN